MLNDETEGCSEDAPVPLKLAALKPGPNLISVLSGLYLDFVKCEQQKKTYEIRKPHTDVVSIGFKFLFLRMRLECGCS